MITLFLLFACRQKVKIDVLGLKDNTSIWQESFWAFRDVLMNCVTINSPIEKLEKPMDVQVMYYCFGKKCIKIM